MKKRVYADNNATTFLSEKVAAAMAPYVDLPLNPSSLHAEGRAARSLLVTARESIAQTLGVTADSLTFTGSATEAIALGIRSFSGHVVTTGVEHPALLNNIQGPITKVSCTHGKLSLSEIDEAITEETSLLLFSYANSETGTLFPIDALATLAKKRGVPLFIDAVGAFGKTPFLLPDGVTGMAFSSHKIHGPHGVGLLYMNDARAKPLYYGGGQEGNRRSGTENVAAIVGFAKACELAKEAPFDELNKKREVFEQKLLEAIPECVILGGSERVANVTCVAFPHLDAESLIIELDMHGIAASYGSACSAGAREPSKVLLNMGYSYNLAKNAVRFSFSRLTTDEEFEHVLRACCDSYRARTKH